MRTWLFVPGHDAHKIDKALHSPADVVVLDWEDAVPAGRKDEARQVTRAALARAPARRCAVRVSSRQAPDFAADLAALAALPVAAVVLPKTADPRDVLDLAAAVEQPIIPFIESPLGVELAFAIARAHPRVERLAFGALDFLADMGVAWAPQDQASQYARARIAVAGRAAGLAGAIDSVYPLLDDQAGLRREAAAARALGFAGKFLLHPAQLAAVREVFAPTPEERARAAEIVAAFQAAGARGEAVVSLRGHFIDPPVVRWAQQILALDEEGPAAGGAGPAGAARKMQ